MLSDLWCTMRTSTQPDVIGSPPKCHELRDNLGIPVPRVYPDHPSR
jgi:hypothetical protein